MMRQVIGSVCLLLLVDCSSSSIPVYVDYVGTRQTYPPQQFITILNKPPDGPYVTIARLRASGTSDITQAQVIDALKVEARALGANALVVTDESRTMAPDFSYNPTGGAAGQYTGTAPQIIPIFSGLAIHTIARQSW